MRTIKIKFVGFWPGFNEKKNIIIDILSKHYSIEYSDSPDYVFCSMFGLPYEYCKYSGIRIFWSGENYSPDFCIVDYAIGFDPMTYTDRYYRFPIYYLDKVAESLDQSKRKTLNNKYFCNFIFGHESANHVREDVFSALDAYKHVISAGSYLNNMPNNAIADTYDKKLEILRDSKFTIACESIDQDGFVTEKLLHALATGSIPIYYGSKSVYRDFNPEAFIDLHDYNNLDDLLNRVKEIDSNPDLYNNIKYCRKYASENQYTNAKKGLEDFLLNIISQDIQTAYRRSKYFQPQAHEKHLLLVNYIYRCKPEKMFHMINQFSHRNAKEH